MHDPSVLFFTIRWPWRDRSPLISIWHRDPEADGSDDSCGWAWPKLSDADRKIVDEIVKWDLDFPFFTSPSIPTRAVVIDPNYSYLSLTPGDAFGYIAAAWMDIAAKKRKRPARLSARELTRIVQLAANPHDGLRSSLIPDNRDPQETSRRFLCFVMRQYLDVHRPWWRHPRWHFHHWRFQVHPWQSFRRMLTRCDHCGERFGWGESAVDMGGRHDPKLKRYVPRLQHSRCAHSLAARAA